MCFNILPNGKSWLHLLATADQNQESDQIAAITASKDLFYQAKKTRENGFIEGWNFKQFNLEVPILPDIYGYTAIDICLDLDKKPDPLGIYKNKILTNSEDDKKSCWLKLGRKGEEKGKDH